VTCEAVTMGKKVTRIDVERAMALAKELRAFAVRSRMRPEDFFSACLINVAVQVKPGYEKRVVKAFAGLIREVRKDTREIKDWEAQEEAHGKEYG